MSLEMKGGLILRPLPMRVITVLIFIQTQHQLVLRQLVEQSLHQGVIQSIHSQLMVKHSQSQLAQAEM
jgi:hypothetical protein